MALPSIMRRLFRNDGYDPLLKPEIIPFTSDLASNADDVGASTSWVRKAVVGAEMYVDGTNGDDANDGLTSGTAVKTLSKAIELAEKRTGQRMVINVAGGTYTESLEIYSKHIYFNLSSDIIINGYIEGFDGTIIVFLNHNVTINSENINALRILNQSYFYASNNVTLNRTGATSTDCMVVSFNSLAVISGNLNITGSNTARSLVVDYSNFVRVVGNLSISDTARLGHAIQLFNGCYIRVDGSVNCSAGDSNIITVRRCSIYHCVGKTTIVSKPGLHGFAAEEQGNIILNGGAAVSGGGLTAINAASFSYSRIGNSFNVSGAYSNAVVVAADSSFIGINNNTTVTGSPTGKRYMSNFNSCIFVYGAGANRIPGTVAGTVDSSSYSYYG